MSTVEGWASSPLGNLMVPKNDKAKQVKSTEYATVGTYPIVDQSSDFICGYHEDPTKVINANLPLTVFGDHTRHTKFVYFPFIAGADGTQLLKPKQEIEDKFFYYLVSQAAEKIGNFGYDRHFKHLKEYVCDFPTNKPEQTKIAEILSTVDRAIEQTEAIIAKQQRIKTGLMQDMLTRGIDEHGNLRSEETHEFKDSPLGRIPVEWRVKNLEECYAEPARNGLYKPKEFYGSGQKMVHMPQMFRGLLVDVQSAVCVDVDRSEIDRFGLKTHDLLIARRSLVLEGAGRCSLVPEINEPTTFESSIIRVRLKLNELDAKFANFFFNSEAGYRMRLPFIRQVAVSGVSGQDVGEYSLPVPHPEEQNRIVELLNQSDNIVKEIKLTAKKLRREKNALMQDLLTGKKRVTPLLNDMEKITS